MQGADTAYRMRRRPGTFHGRQFFFGRSKYLHYSASVLPSFAVIKYHNVTVSCRHKTTDEVALLPYLHFNQCITLQFGFHMNAYVQLYE
jgi:hypothetical protein